MIQTFEPLLRSGGCERRLDCGDQRRQPLGLRRRQSRLSLRSVELALNAAVICSFTAELTARADDWRTRQRLLDYVLGCNALGQAFVTGHGWRSVRRAYHWSMRVYGG